jgi:hypothetical protein
LNQSRDRVVRCQSREHAMAEAVRKSLKEAIQQKGRRVCGQQVESPADIFRIFDTDGSGKLSPDELKSALRRLGIGYNDEQLGRLSEFFDLNGDGEVDYAELLAFLSDEFGPIKDDDSDDGHDDDDGDGGARGKGQEEEEEKRMHEYKKWRQTVAALDEADAVVEAELGATTTNPAAKEKEEEEEEEEEEEGGEEGVTPPGTGTAGTGVERDPDEVEYEAMLAQSHHREQQQKTQEKKKKGKAAAGGAKQGSGSGGGSGRSTQQQEAHHRPSRQAMLAKRKELLRRKQQLRQQHGTG